MVILGEGLKTWLFAVVRLCAFIWMGLDEVLCGMWESLRREGFSLDLLSNCYVHRMVRRCDICWSCERIEFGGDKPKG